MVIAEQLKRQYKKRTQTPADLDRWFELCEQAFSMGYKIEYGWGVYLKLPDGSTITLDE